MRSFIPINIVRKGKLMSFLYCIPDIVLSPMSCTNPPCDQDLPNCTLEDTCVDPDIECTHCDASVYSCDYDGCNGDACNIDIDCVPVGPPTATPADKPCLHLDVCGTDYGGCVLQDECGTDYGKCSMIDNCGFDCPCGFTDTTKQPCGVVRDI